MVPIRWGGYACQFWIGHAVAVALRNSDAGRDRDAGAREDSVPADEHTAANGDRAAHADAAADLWRDGDAGTGVCVANHRADAGGTTHAIS